MDSHAYATAGKANLTGMMAAIDRYDAFISYSHRADDMRLATALQSELERFATPWYRSRSMRVFRDSTNLTASPALWANIEQALERSEWLILVASPHSAASPWVEREVHWWLSHRDPGKILLALSDGELAWAGNAFDTTRSTALAPALANTFAEEPFWIDLRKIRGSADATPATQPRIGDLVAEFAAPIRGVAKDSLVGEHIRQRRRTRSLVQAVVAALSVLLVFATGAAFVAMDQRSNAIDQARRATARQLAATAQSLMSSHIDVAQLLAVQAYETDPNPLTRAALLASLTYSPSYAKTLDAGGPVSVAAGSHDGTVIMAGTQDGVIRRWTRDGKHEDLGRFSSSVRDIQLSADGQTGAAMNSPVSPGSGAEGAFWDRSGFSKIEVPEGMELDAVAVSPSGRFAAAAIGDTSNFDSDVYPHLIRIVDTRSGESKDVPTVADSAQLLRINDDGTFVVVTINGSAERHGDVSDLSKVTATSEPVFAINRAQETMSPDGKFIGQVKDGGWVGITPAGGPVPDGPTFVTDVLPGASSALALSWDSKTLAVANAGSIVLFDLTSKAVHRPAARVLRGTDHSTSVTFYSNDRGLVSASGSSLLLWNLSQFSPLASGIPSSIGLACNACATPAIALHPAGVGVAIVDGFGEQLTIHDADGKQQTIPAGDHGYGPAVWHEDGRVLLATAGGGVEIVRPGQSQKDTAWPAAPTSAHGIVAAKRSTDGERFATIDSDGVITLRDGHSGELIRQLPKPPELQRPARELPAAVNADLVALNDDLSLAAFTDFDRILLVEDLTTGQRNVLPGLATTVAFAGGQLLVRRPNGTIDLLEPWTGKTFRAIPGDRSARHGIAVSTAGGLLAQQLTDDNIHLVDLTAGKQLGSFYVGGSGHRTASAGLAFSPDGTRLYIAHEANDIDDGRLWTIDLRPKSWIKTVCASAGRALTLAEWHQHVDETTPERLACS